MKNKSFKFSSQRNLFFKPTQNNNFKIPTPPLKFIKQIQSTRNLKLNLINNSIKINNHIFDSQKNNVIQTVQNNNNNINNFNEEKKNVNNYKRNFLYENYNQNFVTEKKNLPVTTLPNINRINVINSNNYVTNINNIEKNSKNKIIDLKKIKINKKLFLPNLNFEIKKKKMIEKIKKDEEQKIYNKKTIEFIDDNNDKSFYEEVNNILLKFIK